MLAGCARAAAEMPCFVHLGKCSLQVSVQLGKLIASTSVTVFVLLLQAEEFLGIFCHNLHRVTRCVMLTLSY